MNRSAAEIFGAARELPADQRASFLSRACGLDVSLRAEVEALLRADREAGAFLSSPTAGGAGAAGSREEPGQMIGRYKLLEQIGEGGMGTIWLAEQRESVKRRVALKIIKLGMDTKQVIARFEAERQALAMMDHPHIAKVLDAGATDSGRPYFVMEYIKGIPILEYCDTERLDTRARLALFTSVCHAIQHAHQKGIIHRDIKPSNVLVTLHDGVPVPKVIDFGIAKATNAELTTKTLFTEHRQMVGTPAYMSPEQAEMSGLDIDTRSDVYSLGVLLYELLTGTTPFDVKALLESGFNEMLRAIREDEPHKPSTRISNLGDTGTRTAQQRRVELKKLSLLLRGDLDWIVMKCLEKDRSRRYETANGLAADIQRHLNDEPVTAGAPSASYKLRKFVRRNRRPVLAVVVVVATLVLGVIGTTAGMILANRERDRAEDAKTRARLATAAEADARVAAQRSAEHAIDSARRAQTASELESAARKRAETTTQFVTSALRSSDAHDAGGRPDMTILEAMDSAIADLDSGRFRDDPETEAKLKQTIATILANNGRVQQAEPLFVDSLAVMQRLHSGDHADVVACASSLARVRIDQGRLSEAEALSNQALEMARRLYPGDDPAIVLCLARSASVRHAQGRLVEAERLCGEALEMTERIHPGDHPDVPAVVQHLARARDALGRAAEAETLFSRALEMHQRIHAGDHPDVATSLSNLANQREKLGRLADAATLHTQALEMQLRIYDGDHPVVALYMGNVARVRSKQGDHAESEPLQLQALEMWRRIQPGDVPQTAKFLENLALIKNRLGASTEAESLRIEALEMTRRIHAGDHLDVAKALNNLASQLSASGRAEQAEPLQAESLDMCRRIYAVDHSDLLAALRNLAVTRMNLGRFAEAEPLLVEFVEMGRRLWNDDRLELAEGLELLGQARLQIASFEEAETAFVGALEAYRHLVPGDDPKLVDIQDKLAFVYWSLRELARSIPLYEQVVESRETRLGRQHASTLESLGNLGVNYTAAGRIAEAIPLLEEVYRASLTNPDLGWITAQLIDAYARQVDPQSADFKSRIAPKVLGMVEIARSLLPRDSLELADHLARLSLSLLSLSAWTEAEPVLRQCLTIREELQPGAWNTFNTKSSLGGALLGQNRLAEAEPWLLEGYRGLKEREAAIPPPSRNRLTEALERLVQLYEAKGDAAQAAVWRTELEAARVALSKVAEDQR